MCYPVAGYPLGIFLSTPSGWRATKVGSRPRASVRYFYPRPPGGGRRRHPATPASSCPYFYPRPPGGGRLLASAYVSNTLGISIHALRVEGDVSAPGLLPFSQNFYPRPPGGGRPCIRLLFLLWRYFYPRPPGGGRRHLGRRLSDPQWYFYPRPPGGGRPARGNFHGLYIEIFLSTPSGWRATLSAANEADSKSISIHALRVEGDPRSKFVIS